MLDLSRGLKYLHVDMRSLHRDLKPGNVLIFDGPVAKISDFGVAKELGSQSLLSSMHVGTLFFNAPEILMEERYGRDADIFALGIKSFPSQLLNSLFCVFLCVHLGLVFLFILSGEPELHQQFDRKPAVMTPQAFASVVQCD